MALDDIDASFEGHANRATTNGIDLANLATVHSINGNNTCAISYDHQLTLVSIKTTLLRCSDLLDGRRRIASHIDKELGRIHTAAIALHVWIQDIEFPFVH